MTGVYFAIRLIIPVAVLVVAWGLFTVALLTGRPHRWHWLQVLRSGQHVLAGAAVAGGAGIAVAVVAVVATVLFARRVTRAAQDLAAADIASERHFAASAAAEAATAEAALRVGFSQILSSLGKRNQSLLHRQLRIIDTLEQQAPSPEALADLFALDHLTTRMRRHAESLTILAGAAPGRSWSGPVPVVDVLRAAASEIEDYTRVTVSSNTGSSDSGEAVAASAVIDVIHLLAELIENATLFSPSSTRVEVRAGQVANGFAVEVEDRGLGIPPDQLRELNAQLASPPDFDSADADRLGLFVVGRLAARHGIHVSLTPSPYLGTRAVVVLPDGVVLPAPAIGTGEQSIAALADQPARLNLRAPEVLTLAGAKHQPGPQPETKPETQPERLPEPRLELRLPSQAGSQPAPRPDASPQASSPQASSVQAAAPGPGVTLHGLPLRVRPSDDSPGERAAVSSTPGAREVSKGRAPVESPAPDAARSLAASLQSSWQRSRQGDNPPGAAQAPDSAPESEA